MVQDNRKKVRQVLIITLILNLVVLLLKAVVGTITGSLSLQADALHSVTDSANNILGLVTNQLSSPIPDRDHPYGHQKFEAIGALGIAAFLGIACFEIITGALNRIIFGGDPVKIGGGELWLLIIVLGINIFVAFYERKVGYKIGSKILIADATHTMSDVWITISVLFGLIGVWQSERLNLPQLQYLDILLAFPVAFLVLKSGWQVLTSNLPWLVDQVAIAPELIHKIVTEVPGVINCHDIASRGLLGRQIFIEMHLIVDTEDVKIAHDITEEIERKLEEKFAPVRILIHIEPPEYKSPKISYG
ncbi:cation diffusion facilitator family transporter [Cyanobacterium aponinum UTEX 3222]|uniref:Cation diffusion facilitator family transporter n=2 Tax=Cyanobacterium aponinum TaxID=379064 RepID=A0A844GQG9_9CHRO|nr:cation diffusion facilitator family transporter [Cyanobacterium aponinum]WRL43634.1 cation diffusion facilitator family transporter [Cyanobacterium aponinum UTEX 3222]MBD2394064.1 cation transporter [Cyanobacterium aponinum FACHB-4101]MTF38794.1 cation diffusion facilitator family transporter [Cyanobacterium aponinum 0216]PHV62573.1 cation-efflux pump [Cyanobacterium aponinum IPPAS B-1201]WPF88927.1 cation diffusion facilitator family transporter [Cyanobacterium aponinum AL20115]